jgi:hypothetical protein
MGMGAKPEIWTRDQFRQETNPRDLRKKLSKIDDQLVEWLFHKDGLSTDRRVKILRTLAAECIAYARQQTSRKETKEAKRFKRKPSARLINRIDKTKALLRQVMIRLAYEQFVFQKTSRGAAGTHLSLATRQGLRPGYSHERTEYVTTMGAGGFAGVPSLNNPAGEINPTSSSYLRDCHVAVRNGTLTLNGGVPAFSVNFTTAPFAQLTDGDLDLFAAYLRQRGLTANDLEAMNVTDKPQVHFVRKDERINKNLLIPINGKLYTHDGELYTTGLLYPGQGRPPAFNAQDYGLDIYALDKRGNLLHQFIRNVAGMPRTPTDQWNHSSLVAGQDVICAGMILVYNGDLKYISNESGHYQPDAQKLSNAIAVLMEEYGLDLMTTIDSIRDEAGGQVYASVAQFQARVPPQ